MFPRRVNPPASAAPKHRPPGLSAAASYVLPTERKRRKRRLWGDSHRLPLWCIEKLDAEGKVRGATWRDMPGACNSKEDEQAMAWFMWKRGLLYDGPEKNRGFGNAKRDALLAMEQGEAMEGEV